MDADSTYMQLALALAEGQLGRTWPNPSVGAVVVKDGRILGQAATANGGRPHAEPQALAQAGDEARGATLYVSLEPCSHQGKTPPCVKAILAAGIARVVVACNDTNPLISGSGIEQLRTAGVVVETGLLEAEARALNAGFFSVIERKRPLMNLKIASSMDGKIATSTGHSKWITSEPARNCGHMMRSVHDAILTGMGTVLADDPMLNCRLPGREDRSPVRVVIDRQHRLNLGTQLVKTAKDIPVLLVTTPKHPLKEAFLGHGLQVFDEIDGSDPLFLTKVAQLLAEKGFTRVMVECGAKLGTALLKQGLIDHIYWFRAPIMLGNDAISAFEGGFEAELTRLERLKHLKHLDLPPDTLDIYACLPA